MVHFLDESGSLLGQTAEFGPGDRVNNGQGGYLRHGCECRPLVGSVRIVVKKKRGSCRLPAVCGQEEECGKEKEKRQSGGNLYAWPRRLGRCAYMLTQEKSEDHSDILTLLTGHQFWLSTDGDWPVESNTWPLVIFSPRCIEGIL